MADEHDRWHEVMLAAVHEPVFTWHVVPDRLEWNRPSATVAGHPCRDLARIAHLFALVHERQRADAWQDLQSAVASGDANWSTNLRLLGADGSDAHYALRVAIEPVGAGGSRQRLAGTLRDTSAAVLLGEALAATRDAAAIGSLMNAFAHGGNNRLMVILTCLDMLATNGIPALDRHDALQLALGASRQLADDLAALLAGSRRQGLQSRPVDLAAAIRTACQLHGYGAEPALPITVDVPSGMHVDAEPMQLETAVLRLLLLASRRGAAAVAIRGDRLELAARSDAYPGLRAGRYGCLEVEYSGVALPPRLLCAHAEPGHVLDRLRDPDGLEFAAVEAFVHALRGRLMASNGPGGNARIDLYLPLGVAG